MNFLIRKKKTLVNGSFLEKRAKTTCGMEFVELRNFVGNELNIFLFFCWNKLLKDEFHEFEEFSSILNRVSSFKLLVQQCRHDPKPPYHCKLIDRLISNVHSISIFSVQIMWILITFGLILSTLFDISAFTINTENQQVWMELPWNCIC